MGCFNLQWLEQLLVYLVVVGAVIAILQLLLPWVLANWPPIIVQVVNIILWALICILVIYIIFMLLSCLLGSGGLSLLPPGRH